MKFTYNTPETETRECVAYINRRGTLIFKTDEGVTFFYPDSQTPNHGVHCEWCPCESVRKFYDFDSITITF